MPPMTHLIIHPTMLCNLSCKYCWENGKRSPVKISKNTLYGVANLIGELANRSKNKDFHIDWMGGEPLVMGMNFYDEARSIFSTVCNPKFFFRTNMSLIDDDWAAYIKENKIHIGGSMDGPKDIHDAQRSNSFDAVMAGLTCLKDHKCQTSDIACTLTPDSSKRLSEIFDFFTSLDAAAMVYNTEICSMSPAQTAFNFQQLYHLWAEHGQPYMFPRFWEFQKRVNSVMNGNLKHDCSKGGCGQGWAIIDPAGGCHLCNHENCTTRSYFGNVNDAPATELWNSPLRTNYFDRVREVRRRQCGECMYRFVCYGTCYHHVLHFGGKYDPYCGLGYHTYEVILKSLGYTLEEYKEAVSHAD